LCRDEAYMETNVLQELMAIGPRTLAAA